MHQAMPDRIDVLGCPLDIMPPDALTRWIETMLAGASLAHLVTLNPEYVVRARHDPAFSAAIRKADLVVADGIGVARAARYLHGVSIERTPGVEIVEAVVAMSGRMDAPVYLLGGAAGVADRAIGKLRDRYPDIRVAGSDSRWGPARADDAASVAAIARSDARIVLVAYGAPGQVTWIERNRDRLESAGVRLTIGVGGAFDFHAGDVPRAPGVLRRAGLEWLFRLARQPWRWRRQLALPVFAWLVARERWLAR